MARPDNATIKGTRYIPGVFTGDPRRESAGGARSEIGRQREVGCRENYKVVFLMPIDDSIGFQPRYQLNRRYRFPPEIISYL